MSVKPAMRISNARGKVLVTALVPLLVVATMLVAVMLVVGLPLQVRVVSPRLGMPVIDHAGATMEVRLASSLPFVVPSLQLSLEGPSGVAVLKEASRRYQGVDTVLTMALPTLPDGGYSLRVKSSRQEVLLPKAVFLRQQWPSVLRLVQIADLPPPGREPLMRQFVMEMHAQQPDAVLVTGDINYTGSASNIDFIHDQLAQLDAPVIMTAGNHEREAWHRYLRVFGARDHRTKLGPLTILSVDSAHGRDTLTPSMFRWLDSELKQLDGRSTIIQIHHPIFPPGVKADSEAGGTGGYMRGYRRAFLDLCQQHHVAIVLAGHWHQDAVFDQEGNYRTDRVDFAGTKYVVTTALGADVRAVYEHSIMSNGYRWLAFTNGQLTSYSHDTHNPVPSTPLGTASSTP